MKILKWSFLSKMNMVGKHFVDYFFLPQYFFFYVKSVQKMNLSFQFASSNRANVSPFKLTNTIHFCTQLMTNSWIDLKLLYYYSLLPKFGDILSLVYFQENCMVFPLRRDLTSPLKQLPWYLFYIYIYVSIYMYRPGQLQVITGKYRFTVFR